MGSESENCSFEWVIENRSDGLSTTNILLIFKMKIDTILQLFLNIMPNVKPYMIHFIRNVNTTLTSKGLCCLSKHKHKKQRACYNINMKV